jgi:dTDP-D-glucose 4,6-dehydratase
MLHLITNPSSGVYNLCSGKQYNLKDIIEKIHNIVGNSNKISYNQDITYNPKSKWVCGDNIKILNESKQSPLVSIELGLANTINYYKTI